MNINIILTAKPGYPHSAALLEPARYVAYKLRESGHQVSMHVNRFADAALNVVFGAHEFYEPEWFSKGDIAIFNLEQLARGSQDSHRLDPGYLELLKKYPVIDYDLANVRLYRDHGSELSSLSVPIFEFGYAPYLDVEKTLDIVDRPFDVLFFGSLNAKRIKTLRRIEDCGVQIRCITPDAPVYGEELNRLVRKSKAVLNIPFYQDRIFEQVRVSHALSCGTPVISPRSDRVPEKFLDSVTWFDEGHEAEFFVEKFKTADWYAAATAQIQTWRASDSRMSFDDWEKMTGQAKIALAPSRGSRQREERSPEPERRRAAIGGQTLDDLTRSPADMISSADQLTPKCAIIIPVYNKVELTKQCIDSISEVTPRSLYKVIVIDNGSTDDTGEYLATLRRQVTIISNPNNLGFVDACNMGAAVADTDYLMFLNNDTVVVQGWLESLIAALDADENVGAAGAKLVYPDGTLQEAGAIVFNDGTGWNFGRHEDPFDPKFNVACEVDYCSGAALLVRASYFRQLGGFDKRYAPAYYEDTDLCFALREIGKKVIYVPDAMVIHREGATAGTDITTGNKRFQQLNKVKFATKWASRLSEQRPPPRSIQEFPETNSRKCVHARLNTECGLPLNGVKVLVIDPFLPLHDIASGSLRLFRIIKLIIGLGAKVTYLAINAHNQQRYAAELRGFGVRVIEGHKAMLEKLGYSSDAADFDFKELLIRERFSHAWLSFFHTAEHYLDQIREYLPTTKIIVDSVDVHFVRELRQALRPEGRPVDLEKALDTKVREVKIYNSSDRTIVVSQDDQSALMDAGVVSPISIISNIHDALLNDEATFPTRNGIIFVGNFNHIPNADGIRWFLKNVWPLIHSELPHATLDIIGPNPPEDLLKITSDGIRVRGWVPDLKPYYDNAKVSIAPLRFGAGVKGKVGDSLARGTPVVLTSIAAEGMKLPSSLREFVQDDEAGFAMAVVRLHQDERLWGCIRQEGRSHISQLFGSEVAARGLIDVLALRQNLTKKSTEVVI